MIIIQHDMQQNNKTKGKSTAFIWRFPKQWPPKEVMRVTVQGDSQLAGSSEG